jgi:hypothetical protein
MLVAGLAVAKANFDNEVRASFWATVALGATCLACGLLPRGLGGWVALRVLCGAMGATATCYDVPIVAYMQKSSRSPEAWPGLLGVPDRLDGVDAHWPCGGVARGGGRLA